MLTGVDDHNDVSCRLAGQGCMVDECGAVERSKDGRYAILAVACSMSWDSCVDIGRGCLCSLLCLVALRGGRERLWRGEAASDWNL